MKERKALIEFIRKELSTAWVRMTPIVKMTKVHDLFEDFQKRAGPLIANVVGNEQEARFAVKIVANRIKIKTRKLTYRETGYPESAYDHHGYPTSWDLDDEVAVLSPVVDEIETKEAMALLNDPEGLRKLLDQELARLSQTK